MSISAHYLEIKSDLSLLQKVDKFIKKAVKSFGLDQNDIDGILLSVNEAVSNAIIHGNDYDPEKKVKISIIPSDNELVISIKDQGKGFNPGNVPDPTSPENILKDHGRGIHIIKMCIHDMKYNFTPEGTELILFIKFDKPC